MLGTSDHNIEVGGCGGKQGISVDSCRLLFFVKNLVCVSIWFLMFVFNFIYSILFYIVFIVIKGSLGGETSVLRTFRMSGKELVKERVSQGKVS